MVLSFKNKADVQSCSNDRGIKLISHTMKQHERAVEGRLSKEVMISEQQNGIGGKVKEARLGEFGHVLRRSGG